MQDNHEVEKIYQIIEANKSLLIKSNFIQETSQFLKDWYCFAENQSKKLEQEYVWSIIYGWSLLQLDNGESLQIGERQFEPVPQQKAMQVNLEQILTKKSIFFIHYLSKAQAVVKDQQNIFWINPTLSIQNNAFFKNMQNLIVVLMTGFSLNILELIKMKKINENIRIITVKAIYSKILILLNFVKKCQPIKYKDVQINNVYLLKQDEYLQYGSFLWMPKRSCWYEPTFDLILAPNKAKQIQFLVETQKVSETKFLYYGWKKNFITQENYQKYTTKNNQVTINKSADLTQYFSNIKSDKFKNKKYLEFIKKELIKELDPIQQQQVWQCFQELHFTKNQVIVKKGYLFDYLFILLEGQFEFEKKAQQEKIQVNRHALYGLSQLVKEQKYYQFTIKSVSQSTVMRITKQNLKFHIFDYLQNIN